MNVTLQKIDKWEDYFIVTDGCIEIMGEYPDSGMFYANREITEILQNEPTGEAMKFDRLAIHCDCGKCTNVLLVYDDGGIAVESVVKGRVYSAQIDPRYNARIFEYWRKKEVAKAKREAKKLAEAKLEANEPA